jgi:hypothetical protein
MRDPEQLLIKAADLPTLQHTPGGFVRFLHGDEQGFGGISFIVSDNPPGGGAIEHRHPDREVLCCTRVAASTPWKTALLSRRQATSS